MNLQCGIVGLPNVGKSTLFNALLKQNVALAANFPFATIEPNVGMVAMEDPRLNILAKISKSKKVIPNMVNFIDIAGLVKGASQGEGLGNQFLGHVREVQAICHIVRCFDDENISHVSHTIDPIRDIQTLDTEFRLADLESLEQRIIKNARKAKGGDKEAQHLDQLMQFVKSLIESDKPIKRKDYPDITIKDWNTLGILSSIPVLYILNVDEQDHAGNAYTQKCMDFIATKKDEALIVPISLSAQMIGLQDVEKQEYLDLLGLQQEPHTHLIQRMFHMLNQITYFTSGEQETRAWNITQGTMCDDAAAVIHTDFKKGFIAAEVVGYDDFIDGYSEKNLIAEEPLGWVKAKNMGKIHLEGKQYIVQDGDVLLFRFNV